MLGNDPVARDALGSLFDAATGGDKDTPIYLRADRRVPYGEVMRIMELLRAAGYAKLLLVGHESESQPSASIVIEFAPVPLAPVPLAPGAIPPWNWTAERAAAGSFRLQPIRPAKADNAPPELSASRAGQISRPPAKPPKTDPIHPAKVAIAPSAAPALRDSLQRDFGLTGTRPQK
jgi:hypothetical protein